MSPPPVKSSNIPRAHVLVLYDRLKDLEDMCAQKVAAKTSAAVNKDKWSNRPKVMVHRQEAQPNENLLRNPVIPAKEASTTEHERGYEDEDGGMYGEGLHTGGQQRVLELQQRQVADDLDQLASNDDDEYEAEAGRAKVAEVAPAIVPIKSGALKPDDVKQDSGVKTVSIRKAKLPKDVPWYYVGSL